MLRMLVAAVSVVALALGGALAGAPAPAKAAVGSQFDAGYIISDTVFFDGYSMTSTQIQSFVEAQIGTCYGTCLSTYKQDTPTMPADNYCSSYTGGRNETAALIISKVGRACGISQKVLLVLLEKEQSLVTANNPSASRFRAATGMACPDTAPCDPAFSGFFYQVFYAAKQYQRYAAWPEDYNYQAGRVNAIRYDTDNCGTKNVFIVNQATAGLYNYTPYTPNAAALNNLYGIGDDCSSYGNRNFWRIFSDWFGSPIAGSSLVRTEASSSVYLIAGDKKYTVSAAMLKAYSKLGPVGFVSQQFLDGYATGGKGNLLVRTTAGTIGLLDNGAIRPMSSCTVVSYYGGNCSGGYIQLDEYQSTLFTTGSTIQTYLTDASGARYVIRDGVKREVLDDASLTAAAITTGKFMTVAATTTAALPQGVPIVRDSVFIGKRGTADYVLYTASEVHAIAADAAPHFAASARAAGSLTSGSLGALGQSDVRFDGVVSSGGAIKVIGTAGVVTWDPAIAPPVQPPVAISSELLATYPDSGVTVTAGTVLTGITKSSNYLVTATQLRPFSSQAAWTALGSSVQQVAVSVPNIVIRYHPRGSSVLTTGTLVKVSGGKSIFLVDGLESRIQVPSLDVTAALGIKGYTTVSAATVAGYPTTGSMLSYAVSCDGSAYIAVAGVLRPASAEVIADYGVPVTALDPSTCARLTVGADMPTFIRVNSRSIYMVVDGVKRQIMSVARYGELRGSQVYVNVTTRFADQIPTGPAA
ncbi:hypothetical protein BH11ACT5_BH11ACT5_15080 [soil metagenome]